MNKEISNIVKLAGGHHGTIFGGFVRDLICGKNPTDIDIKLIDYNSFNMFFYDLCHLYNCKIQPMVIIEDSPKYGLHSIDMKEKCRYGLHHVRVTSPDFTSIPHIDVVIGDPYYKSADADINLLMLDADNTISVYDDMFPICDIISRIIRKEFIKLVTCSSDRYQKLIDQGWKEVKETI